MSERTKVEVTLAVNGRSYRVLVEPRRTLADTLQGRLRPHGNPPGVRARRVRGLHDPGRRPTGPVLPDVRRPVRGHGPSHGRGPGRR